MDIGMPRCDGITATRLVKAETPDAKVLILTASAANHDVSEAMRAGAAGFLLKSMDAEHLIAALEGAVHDAPPQAERILAEGSAAQSSTPISGSAAGETLSARQEEVLALLAQGLSYQEVADRVSLTPRTVKYHMGEIVRKLHLRNRAQVVAYGGAMGLGADPERG